MEYMVKDFESLLTPEETKNLRRAVRLIHKQLEEKLGACKVVPGKEVE